LSVSTGTVLRWLASLLKAYRKKVAGAVVALLVAASTWLLLGQGIRMAVDRGLIAADMSMFNQAAFIVIILCIIGSVATYARFYLMTWLGERISADIRQQVYRHLLSLPPSFFAEVRTGEVISRFTSDTTVIQSVIGMSLSMAIRSALTLTGALILMTISSPVLTLCVLLTVPLILIPLRVLAPKIRHYAKQSQDRIADLGAQIDETLHEIMLVQAFNAENRETSAFNNKVDVAMLAANKRIHYRSLLIMLIMVVSMVAIVGIAWLGARQVYNQDITAGELSAFLFYAVMAGGSIATISEVIGDIQRGVGASERLLELLQTKSELTATGEQLPTIARPPTIKFAQLTFTYDNKRDLFTDLTLTIKAGQCVALVGPSGAGKSTLFQLLMRFYNLKQGNIYIDDHNIADISLQALREQIAIVPQEPVIFASSVLDNIRYAVPDAPEDAVIAAAKAAFADDFINALPDQYQTQLGERGVRLSGGQRQRIAIARAILADRPILLLDEATSALDAVSERAVQDALNYLIQGRTTIVIAHRLATVRHADTIVVMDDGHIRATGSHEELMKNDALYREYAELQLLH
jgi:ATP-binding cassette subfamily B protein